MKFITKCGMAMIALLGFQITLNAQQRSQVGNNIAGLGEFFTDAVKQGDGNFSTLTTVYDDKAVSDGNGWPLEDAAFEFNRASNLYPGTYAMSFQGKASVYPTFFHCQWIVAGDPRSPYTDTLPLGAGYNSSTNTTSAQMVVTGFGGNDALNFTSTARNDGSGQAGIVGLHLYKPVSSGSSTSFTSATLFLPSATTGYTDYDYFRFMAGTNWCLIQNWADRVRPGHPADTRVLPSVTYYGFVANPGPEAQNGAIEYEVAWCNQLNKDLYINIPFMATDSYITNLAEAIAFGTDGTNPYTSVQSNPIYAPLKSNLHVYIEYSNEVWNFAFDQAHECQAVAQSTSTSNGINYDGNYNGSFSLELMENYLATRITATSNDFRAVFGDSAMPGKSSNPRIRPVLEWQYDNYNGSAAGELQFMFNWYNNGDGRMHVSNPRPPSYYLWGGGGAVYYGSNFDSSANPDPADTPYTPTLVNSIFNSSIPETGTGDGDYNYRTRGTVAWAKYFGLHAIAYEGGMGVGNDAAGPWNAANPTAAAIARTDSRATAPEETSLNDWTAAGGDAYTFGTYDQFNGNPLNGPLELGIQAYTQPSYLLPLVNNGTIVPGSITGQAQTYDYFRSEDYYGAYKGASQVFLVNAAASGTYNLTVNYASGASNVNYLIVAVNGVVVSPSGGLALPNNGDRVTPSTPLSVPLNAGLNGIRVYALTGAGINLDGITVSNSSGAGGNGVLVDVQFGGNTFTAGQNSAVQAGAATVGTSGDAWNDITNINSLTSGVALNQVNGTSSGVTLTVTPDGGASDLQAYSVGSGGGGGAVLQSTSVAHLYQGFLVIDYSHNTGGNIVLSGLTAGTNYTLYVYSAPNANRSAILSLNGGTPVTVGPNGTATTLGAPNNYVMLSGVADTSGKLTLRTTLGSGGEIDINGLQLQSGVAASPQIIDVQIGGNTFASGQNSAVQTGVAVVGAAGDIWNDITNITSLSSGVALNKVNGTSAGVTLTVIPDGGSSGLQAYSVGSGGGGGAVLQSSNVANLFQGFLVVDYSHNTGGNIVFSGLTVGATYKLYVFSAPNASRSVNLSLNGGTSVTIGPNGSANSLTSPNNYVLLSGPADSTGKLNLRATMGTGGEIDINGFQLQPQ